MKITIRYDLNRDISRRSPECLSARTGDQLPVFVLGPCARELRYCLTGPDEGVSRIASLGDSTTAQRHEDRQTPRLTREQEDKLRQMSAITRAMLFASRSDTMQLPLEDFIALIFRSSLLQEQRQASEQQLANGSDLAPANRSADALPPEDDSEPIETPSRPPHTTFSGFAEFESLVADEQQDDNGELARRCSSTYSMTHVGTAPTATIDELDTELGPPTPTPSTANRSLALHVRATATTTGHDGDRTPTAATPASDNDDSSSECSTPTNPDSSCCPSTAYSPASAPEMPLGIRTRLPEKSQSAPTSTHTSSGDAGQ